MFLHVADWINFVLAASGWVAFVGAWVRARRKKLAELDRQVQKEYVISKKEDAQVQITEMTLSRQWTEFITKQAESLSAALQVAREDRATMQAAMAISEKAHADCKAENAECRKANAALNLRVTELERLVAAGVESRP